MNGTHYVGTKPSPAELSPAPQVHDPTSTQVHDPTVAKLAKILKKDAKEVRHGGGAADSDVGETVTVMSERL